MYLTRRPHIVVAEAGSGLDGDHQGGVMSVARAMSLVIPVPEQATPLFETVHHVGITVADLERSIVFWSRFLGQPGHDRRVLEGPGLGRLLGYPRARIDTCWFDLPGGAALELLEYLEPVGVAHDPGTAHPGNIHVCFHVPDIEAAHAHAVAAGASPVSLAPITVVRGPYAGSRIACLRDPDGVTIELISGRLRA